MKNKRGDLSSLIILVVIIFGLAIGAVLGGHILLSIFGEFRNQPEFQNTTAGDTVEDVEGKTIGYLDFFIFFLLIAMIIGIIVSATMIDTHPVILIVFIVGMFITIFLAGILANVYYDVTTEEALLTTSSQFSMTNLILGSHFPIIMFVVAIITIIILYGKSKAGIT
jgi:hypothetical protein